MIILWLHFLISIKRSRIINVLRIIIKRNIWKMQIVINEEIYNLTKSLLTSVTPEDKISLPTSATVRQLLQFGLFAA